MSPTPGASQTCNFEQHIPDLGEDAQGLQLCIVLCDPLISCLFILVGRLRLALHVCCKNLPLHLEMPGGGRVEVIGCGKELGFTYVGICMKLRFLDVAHLIMPPLLQLITHTMLSNLLEQ